MTTETQRVDGAAKSTNGNPAASQGASKKDAAATQAWMQALARAADMGGGLVQLSPKGGIPIPKADGLSARTHAAEGGTSAGVTVSGGLWEEGAAVNGPGASPQVPAAVASESAAVAQRLTAGDTLREIANESGGLSGEVINGALELLGISNRQIGAYTEQNIADPTDTTIDAALRARLSIDPAFASRSGGYTAQGDIDTAPGTFNGALGAVARVTETQTNSGLEPDTYLARLLPDPTGLGVSSGSRYETQITEARAQGAALIESTTIADPSKPVVGEGPNGSTQRVKTLPDGGTLTAYSWPDGRTKTVEERADGTVVTRESNPDASGRTHVQHPNGASLTSTTEGSTTTTTNVTTTGESTTVTRKPGETTTVKKAADGETVATVVEYSPPLEGVASVHTDAEGTVTTIGADGATLGVEHAPGSEPASTLHAESAADALKGAYADNGITEGERLSTPMLATLAQAAAAGGAADVLGALTEAQAKSFTDAARDFAADNGLDVSDTEATRVFGNALSWDLGLEQSAHGVEDQWVELGRPGDRKFTAYYSVARQLYVEKYGEAAALKLDEAHRVAQEAVTNVEGFAIAGGERIDLNWQYEQLDAVMAEAIAEYQPEYDAEGNLLNPHPVTRIAQFAKTWDFRYGDGTTPTLERPVVKATDLQAKAELANLGDTASGYGRYMDLGSANPGWINVLEGIFTLGIANAEQDLISQQRSAPIYAWMARELQARGRDAFAANSAADDAIAQVVLDGAITAVSVIDPLLRAPGALAALTEVGSEAAGAGIVTGAELGEQALSAASAESLLGRTAPVTLEDVEAGSAVTLSSGERSFAATAVARDVGENAYYAPVTNITGADTEETVRVIPTNQANTQWAAVDESGNFLGRVKVNANGELELTANSHSMLGRIARNVQLVRQVGSGAQGLPGLASGAGGDVLTATAFTEESTLGERGVATAASNPWEAPPLTRGFAASAVTDAGAAARSEVVDVLTSIGSGTLTEEQGEALLASLETYTRQQFPHDLDLTETTVPNDFSQADRARMLNMLVDSGALDIEGMDQSTARFFGVLRPGESPVAPGLSAAQTATTNNIASNLSKQGLVMSQAEFSTLTEAEKTAWINKTYNSIAKSLGLSDPPLLQLVNDDPATMAKTLYGRGSEPSTIAINKDGVLRGKQGFNDIGSLINLMTHELTHAKQFELVTALETGESGLSAPFKTQARLNAVGDVLAQQAEAEYGADSLDPNYRHFAHEAQAYDMGDSVQEALQAEFDG